MTSQSANPRARPLINLYHKVVNFHKTTRNLLHFFMECCWWWWRCGEGGGLLILFLSFFPPPFSSSAFLRNNKLAAQITQRPMLVFCSCSFPPFVSASLFLKGMRWTIQRAAFLLLLADVRFVMNELYLTWMKTFSEALYLKSGK